MIRRAPFPLLLCLLLAAAPATAQAPRDANCDGVVDEADRAAVRAAAFAPLPPPCTAADVNRDGQIGAADLIGLAHGPRITFVGVASPDGQPAPPLGHLPDGAAVYHRNSGFGFLLVVEAGPPPSGAAIGTSVFDSGPRDPARRPDFQIVVEHALGDGSRTVCDEFGVPANDALDFAMTQGISDAINDLACRFAVATRANAACTQSRFGQPTFVEAASRAQFCLAVTGSMAFPAGETRMRVQVRDDSGLVGPAGDLVLQVAPGPMPPTFTPPPATSTPTATETATPTASATRTPTPSATPSVTRTRTPTRTFTRTLTPTRTHTPLPSPTRTRTATPANTATVTITPRTPSTATRTATRTPTSGVTPPTATRTRTPTPSPTPSGATPTRTRTRTPTPPSGGATPTVTRTPSRTRTRTPTAGAGGSGPVITFFGLTRADDMLLEPSGTENGMPVYSPAFGFGFSLVVEAKIGESRVPPGTSTFDAGGAPPDLQIQVTRPLGDGSSDVCDDMPPLLGGVPAIDPPLFSDEPSVAARLNDLGCRFVDGSGERLARQCGEANACVLGIGGTFGCASADGTFQYCGFIASALTFPPGDTLVSVRVRDRSGNLGPLRQLILRVP